MKRSIYEYVMNPKWTFLDKHDGIGGPFAKFSIGEPIDIFKK